MEISPQFGRLTFKQGVLHHLYINNNVEYHQMIIVNRPQDLLCVDFTTMDPSRDSKENVLVLTDAFSKFSQAFLTPNQKALTMAKIIVDK